MVGKRRGRRSDVGIERESGIYDNEREIARSGTLWRSRVWGIWNRPIAQERIVYEKTIFDKQGSETGVSKRRKVLQGSLLDNQNTYTDMMAY